MKQINSLVKFLLPAILSLFGPSAFGQLKTSERISSRDVPVKTTQSETRMNMPGDMKYWDGRAWIYLPAGLPGQVLTQTDNGSFAWVSKVGGPGPGGGVVFYDKGSYSSGWRYLEAAPFDQGVSIQWGCYGTPIYSSGVAIGTGKANTEIIVQNCNEQMFAAKLCSDLVLNGYDDWYLPSAHELKEMFNKKLIIGNFNFEKSYWSSTMGYISAQDNAIGYIFNPLNAKQVEYERSGEATIVNTRAIRAF